MRHEDYVAAREAREPRFADERVAAAAELQLASWFAERRETLGLSLAGLAEDAGIPEDRLEALEEGDTMTVNELLWLCRALDVSLSIGSELNIDVTPVLQIHGEGAALTPAGLPVGVARS